MEQKSKLSTTPKEQPRTSETVRVELLENISGIYLHAKGDFKDFLDTFLLSVSDESTNYTLHLNMARDTLSQNKFPQDTKQTQAVIRIIERAQQKLSFPSLRLTVPKIETNKDELTELSLSTLSTDAEQNNHKLISSSKDKVRKAIKQGDMSLSNASVLELQIPILSLLQHVLSNLKKWRDDNRGSVPLYAYTSTSIQEIFTLHNELYNLNQEFNTQFERGSKRLMYLISLTHWYGKLFNTIINTLPEDPIREFYVSGLLVLEPKGFPIETGLDSSSSSSSSSTSSSSTIDKESKQQHSVGIADKKEQATIPDFSQHLEKNDPAAFWLDLDKTMQLLRLSFSYFNDKWVTIGKGVVTQIRLFVNKSEELRAVLAKNSTGDLVDNDIFKKTLILETMLLYLKMLAESAHHLFLIFKGVQSLEFTQLEQYLDIQIEKLTALTKLNQTKLIVYSLLSPPQIETPEKIELKEKTTSDGKERKTPSSESFAISPGILEKESLETSDKKLGQVTGIEPDKNTHKDSGIESGDNLNETHEINDEEEDESNEDNAIEVAEALIMSLGQEEQIPDLENPERLISSLHIVANKNQDNRNLKNLWTTAKKIADKYPETEKELLNETLRILQDKISASALTGSVNPSGWSPGSFSSIPDTHSGRTESLSSNPPPSETTTTSYSSPGLGPNQSSDESY